MTVGVINRDFRPSDPEIAGAVGAYRAFDDTDGEWAHGTAVASVVADTAPNATLHLAAVGPSTSPEQYRDAVDWLRASGADVVVDAGSYFRQPGDGPIAGRITVELQWAAWPTAVDYDRYLVEARESIDRVVANSKTRQDGDDAPTERIAATVKEGRYYVAVRAHNATGTHDLELYASHSLGVSTANGSLTAPGTAPRASDRWLLRRREREGVLLAARRDRPSGGRPRRARQRRGLGRGGR